MVTGFPNYPGGKLYPGYRLKPLQRDLMDGVSILRVPMYPSHDSSSLRRALGYVSYAVSAVVLGTPFTKKPDVIYAYHPPLTVGFAAIVIGLLKGAPFVLDIQDLWPDTLKATGMVRNKRVLDLVGMLARWVYRRAALRGKNVSTGTPRQAARNVHARGSASSSSAHRNTSRSRTPTAGIV